MNNEEMTEEQIAELGTELAMELQTKSTNIIAYIVDSEGLLARIKAEEERLAELRKKGEAKLAKFKTYVQDNMKALNLEKISTELGNMSIAKNPMSIEIEDESAIPEEFKKVETKISIDKTKIKEHFKATGEIVAGTKVINDKTTLRIK